MRAFLGIAAVVLCFCLPVQAQEDEDDMGNPGLAGLSEAQTTQYGLAEEAFSSGDYAKAHKILDALKAQDVAAAWWLRGVLVFQGLGVKKDDAVSRNEFLQAAKMGGGFYQVSIGDLYRDGTAPFAKDCDQAETWYKRAASAGNEQGKGRVKRMPACRGKAK